MSAVNFPYNVPIRQTPAQIYRLGIDVRTGRSSLLQLIDSVFTVSQRGYCYNVTRVQVVTPYTYIDQHPYNTKIRLTAERVSELWIDTATGRSSLLQYVDSVFTVSQVGAHFDVTRVPAFTPYDLSGDLSGHTLVPEFSVSMRGGEFAQLRLYAADNTNYSYLPQYADSTFKVTRIAAEDIWTVTRHISGP